MPKKNKLKEVLTTDVMDLVKTGAKKNKELDRRDYPKEFEKIFMFTIDQWENKRLKEESQLDTIKGDITEIKNQHNKHGNNIVTINGNLKTIFKILKKIEVDQNDLNKLDIANKKLIASGKRNSDKAEKVITERNQLRELKKELNSKIGDLEGDKVSLEQKSKSPIDKFKHLICNESDLSEVISAIEKPLFEDKNSHKSGLLNAIMILDSLVDLRNLKKEYGKNAKEIFSYSSEKEMAQLFSTYLCKAYNKKNIIELNDLNILIDAFNSRADHYEILHYPEKQEMLDDKIHMLINDSDSAMRVDKYHSLPIKPKATDLAAAKVVKALVEAI